VRGAGSPVTEPSGPEAARRAKLGPLDQTAQLSSSPTSL
jgi:hypothetical protein